MYKKKKYKTYSLIEFFKTKQTVLCQSSFTGVSASILATGYSGKENCLQGRNLGRKPSVNTGSMYICESWDIFIIK